jgi:anti-sigma factor RsiW
METVQGFNIRRWTDQGLNMLAVSDINREELDEFGNKFEAAAHAARAT